MRFPLLFLLLTCLFPCLAGCDDAVDCLTTGAVAAASEPTPEIPAVPASGPASGTPYITPRDLPDGDGVVEGMANPADPTEDVDADSKESEPGVM